jgi:hypothetical protein
MGTTPQHADQQKTSQIFLEMMTAEERREYANWEALLDAANRGIRRWRGPVTRIIAVDHERKAVTVQQEGA